VEPVAAPITGQPGVLWRLRFHTGAQTELGHQLRKSCILAFVSCDMVRWPVRSLRPLDGGWLGQADIEGEHQLLLQLQVVLVPLTAQLDGPTRLDNSPCAVVPI
jgi:hypothetical protein